MRKEPQFDIRDCYIEKIVMLKEETYKYFLSHMLNSFDFIAENTDVMYSEKLGDGNYIDHCLLVMGEESEDGVLVESEGADYARYTSYQPNAKSFVREQIKTVADAILAGQFGKTSETVRVIGCDDIKEQFDITVTKDNGIGQLLIDELQNRDEIAGIIVTDDSIEMSVITKLEQGKTMTREEEGEDKMNKQNMFIENVNKVLEKVDLEKLDESCNGEDKTYAKEVIKQMHNAFVLSYGNECLYEGDYEFVQMPAVIQGRDTGYMALGVVTIDLESSGEHWGTFFLTPHGVLDQGSRNLTMEEKDYIREKFIPYDYYYTPKVDGDIHVGFENVPEQIDELLKICREEQIEVIDNNMDMNM